MINLAVQCHELLFLEPDLDLHEDFACDEQHERSRFREHQDTVYDIASTSILPAITNASIGEDTQQYIIIC